MSRPTRLAFVAAAAVLGLIGFEEVSWFQRVIGIDTPDWLAGLNDQNELNFHNAITWPTEQLYYAGAFALCVLGRFSSDIIRFPAARLMPSLAIMAAGAIACGVNYDMWPTVPVQLAVFVALSAMIAAALASNRADRHRRRLLWGAVGALVLTQVAFLAFGTLLTWPQQPSELRETLIALTLLAYAVQVAAPYWGVGMARLSAGEPRAAAATARAKSD